VSAARRHARQQLEAELDPAQREEIFRQLLAEEQTLKRLPEKYRARLREEAQLMGLLQRVHDEHDLLVRRGGVAGQR
jgi:tellurite resistance protein TerC